jgi:uncharacterized protein (DUF427 family)
MAAPGRPADVVPVRPGPGQESVWDYPRPPRVEPSGKRVRVEFAGTVIAESAAAQRVLETAGPPCWYLPAGDIRMDLLKPAEKVTVCEWKGRATHFDVLVGDRRAGQAAWSYRRPLPGFEVIAGHVAFYPGRVDACFVDGERVRPQPGEYYGGWITDDVVGPFKGEPGSSHWSAKPFGLVRRRLPQPDSTRSKARS